MKTYWVSSPKFTGCVDVKEGVIIRTPPCWKIFKGQKYAKFLNWLKKSGSFWVKEINYRNEKLGLRFTNENKTTGE